MGISADFRRKRSGKVMLTTMAALGTSTLLAGCGDGDPVPAANAAQSFSKPKDAQEVRVYENVFECAKLTGLTREQCGDMRSAAIARAADEAPRFAAIQDCEEEFGAGQCMQEGGAQNERRRHFSPFVIAWISGAKNRDPAPLFKSKAGGFQAANGMRLGYAGAPGKFYASARSLERAKSIPAIKPASKMAKEAAFGTRATKSWNLADRDGGKGKGKGGKSKGG